MSLIEIGRVVLSLLLRTDYHDGTNTWFSNFLNVSKSSGTACETLKYTS